MYENQEKAEEMIEIDGYGIINGGDLAVGADMAVVQDPGVAACFDAAPAYDGDGDGRREIWDHEQVVVNIDDDGNFLDVNDSSIFYNDDHFPHLPDFPCMSSSSSSSSTPAPTRPITASSSASSTTSSAASWAVVKSNGGDGDEDDFGVDEGTKRKKNRVCDDNKSQSQSQSQAAGFTAPAGALSSTASMDRFPAAEGSGTVDCTDVMENFGYMDLIDSNDIWDPSSIFYENPDEFRLDDDQQHPPPPPQQRYGGMNSNSSEVMQDDDGGDYGRLDELGEVFFEWLKSNKEHISAEDMRNIKLRRSTIDSASKRLGSTKEGKKQLLKLILEWVAQYQLQKKGITGVDDAAAAAAATTAAATTTQYPYPQPSGYPAPPPPPPQPFQNPNPKPSFNCNSSVPPTDRINPSFSPHPWNPPAPSYPAYMSDHPVPAPPPGFSYIDGGGSSSSSSGGGDPYNSGINCHTPYNNPVSSEQFQVLDAAKSWSPSMVPQYNNPFHNIGNSYAGGPVMPIPAGYPDHYPYPPQVYNGAANCGGDQGLFRLGSSATKEARKKRMARQRRIYTHHHHGRTQNNHHQQNLGANVDENCTMQANWGYWSPPSAVPSPVVTQPLMIMDVPPPAAHGNTQSQHSQKQAASLDKRQGWKYENLKFLLQKVLKQSDVGSLGRIVLPKKEAEGHLPELDTRDGITLAMEDIRTSNVWNMRYRFWPNNKSRMYLLENTGDFVKANGLQEGDFIVIYCDIKCGKYLIRGVKVRQSGTKTEGKKPAKRNQRSANQACNGGSPSNSPSTKPTD